MHASVRRNIQRELQTSKLEAYLAVTPANFYYTSGAFSEFLDLSWRMTGTDFVLVPADTSREPVLIVSEFSAAAAERDSGFKDIRTYPTWIEARDLDLLRSQPKQGEAMPRRDLTEQFDQSAICRLVRDVLSDWNCADKHIATDLDFMQVETRGFLEAALPNANFVDFADVMYRLRSIKHPKEIERLRAATIVFGKMQEKAFGDIRQGYCLNEMLLNCQLGAVQFLSRNPEMGDFQGLWAFNSIGDGRENGAQEGDVIKLDAGVRIGGYFSDCARVACLGTPSDDVVMIHDALLRGYEAAAAQLKPGNTMQDVYGTALGTVRESGLPNYSRGHFGHSIGLDDLVEERPFIGSNQTVLEPGMVLCLELPYYPPGIGGFNIEDLWLITETGAECLYDAPRGLRLM